MGDSLTRHHIRPRSRGGGRRHNIVILPQTFHRALHTLFHDLTLEESHLLLDIVMAPGTTWTDKQLHELRWHIRSRRG